MTPTIQSRRDEFIENWLPEKCERGALATHQERCLYEGFNAAVPIVRTETIKMVLGLLRERPHDNRMRTTHHWADWLEKNLTEMEDKI